MTRQVDGQRVRVAAWFALVFLIAYLVLLGGGWFGIYDVRLRVISLVLIVVGLAAWVVAVVRRPEWRPRTAIWPAFVVALAAFGLSLALSATPRLGADYFAYAILLTALYLLLQRLLADEFFRPRVLWLSAVLFVVIGVLYAVVVMREWVTWWGFIGRITTPPLRPNFEGLGYGNPSAVMTMAILLLAPSLAYLGFDSVMKRVVAAALTGLALLVTLLSGSRAGWLALAIAVAVTAALGLLAPGNRARLRGLFASTRARVAAGAVVVGAALLALLFAPGILLRVGGGGEELRGTFYTTSIRMFESSPLVGTGPGTWAPLRGSFTNAGEIDYYVPHAHSLYLQTLAEFGLLGVGAGVVVAVCLLWLIRNAIRDPDATRRRFGWAALFGTAYFAAHQILDFYPNMPAAVFVYAIPIAWLDATSPRPLLAGALSGIRARLRSARPLAIGAAVAAALISVAWLGRSEVAAIQMNNGVLLANDGRWTEAESSFESAARMDPGIAPYQLTYGIAAADAGDLPAAAEALLRAASIDDLPASWLDLAAVRAQQGDGAGARVALGRALRLGTQQASINMGAGAVWLALGDQDLATDSFVLALEQVPSLAGDPWWQSSDGLAAIWPDILERATNELPDPVAFEMALSGGNIEQATVIADRSPDPTTREFNTTVVAAWSGDPNALGQVYARCAASPLDTSALGWCARLAGRAGDTTRAQQYRTWADLVSPGSGSAGFEVRVTTAPPGVNVAGSITLFYGHYTYRRPTPWDSLVRGLPHLAYQ